MIFSDFVIIMNMHSNHPLMSAVNGMQYNITINNRYIMSNFHLNTNTMCNK